MRNFLSEHPSKSVSTRNGHQSKQATRVNSGFDTWGLGTESFFATPTSSPLLSKPISKGTNAQPFGKPKITDTKPVSQPSGWAGFQLKGHLGSYNGVVMALSIPGVWISWSWAFSLMEGDNGPVQTPLIQYIMYLIT
uniref:Uncharacterized protein n=1 Tax=Quercus lobata TaxID=97700 RepID=A0A7N2LBR2_QUELO